MTLQSKMDEQHHDPNEEEALPDSVEAVRALSERAATDPEALSILHQLIAKTGAGSDWRIWEEAVFELPLPLSQESIALLQQVILSDAGFYVIQAAEFLPCEHFSDAVRWRLWSLLGATESWTEAFEVAYVLRDCGDLNAIRYLLLHPNIEMRLVGLEVLDSLPVTDLHQSDLAPMVHALLYENHMDILSYVIELLDTAVIDEARWMAHHDSNRDRKRRIRKLLELD